MSISITVSGNLETRKNWSGMVKHFDHDPALNHSNKFLNSSQSQQLKKFNKHVILDDYQAYCNSLFSTYVKSHDKSCQPTKKYHTVASFMNQLENGKKRPQPLDKSYMLKLGDKDSYQNYINVLTTTISKKQNVSQDEAQDIAIQTTVKGFKKYIKDFNGRNPNLHMFEAYIHADEEGAIHLHSRVLPYVIHSKKLKNGSYKKPSFSLNTALSDQYGIKRNGRAALQKFRKVEDTALLEALNDTTINELNINPDFKLNRKKEKDPTIKTGLTHEQYIQKQTSKKLQKIKNLEKSITTLTTENENLSQQNNKLVTTNSKLTKTISVKQNQVQKLDLKIANSKVVIEKGKQVQNSITRLSTGFLDEFEFGIARLSNSDLQTKKDIESMKKVVKNESFDEKIESLEHIDNYGWLGYKAFLYALKWASKRIPKLVRISKSLMAINLSYGQNKPSETQLKQKHLNKNDNDIML